MAVQAQARATLVVAGRSARLMAEAAARDGYEVIALDVFGDVETRRAARRWQPIAAGEASLRMDAQRLLGALRDAAGEPGMIGWVAGSDFECEPELLAQAAQVLPLIGTAPDAVRRVRDPAGFFDRLDALGLPHPRTQLAAPREPDGWLRKEARGTGGWHIRRADDAHPADAARQPYFQREATGRPMSALFVANGERATLIGFNELIVRALGAHPHVYRGAIGPVALPDAAQRLLLEAIDRLSAAFSLRGLCSLDFMLDGEHCALLEINPRPSASMALYADQPLLRAHVGACTGDPSPTPPAVRAEPVEALHCARFEIRGIETVYARAALRLTSTQADALAARPDCHDLPAAGSAFAAGDPVCSVSALGNNAAEVRALLTAKRQALRAELLPAR